MYKGFKVIDSDAHITEPHDLWSEFMEPEYYHRRPIVGPASESRVGASRSFMECEIFPEGNRVKTTIQGAGVNREVTIDDRDVMAEKYGAAYDKGFTPESRIEHMDVLGWDKQVLIDNGPHPLRVSGRDQGLLWACARAYNNFSRNFCDTDPSRIKMVGVLPNQHDIEGLVTETRRVIDELGAVTVTMPRAEKGRPWHDPAYDPFWALAEELDFPVSFHGVSSGEPHTGVRYQPRSEVSGPEVALEHAIGFPFENMISLGHLIFLGVLERFPNLRVSFLEGNAGWLPFWLGRLNDHGMRDKRQGYVVRPGNAASQTQRVFPATGLCGLRPGRVPSEGRGRRSGRRQHRLEYGLLPSRRAGPGQGAARLHRSAHLRRQQAQDSLGQRR